MKKIGLGAWYATYLVQPAVLTVVAAYAFHISLAGQKLLPRALRRIATVSLWSAGLSARHNAPTG